MKEGVDSLWKNEDYWAIWFGFIIIIGTLLGCVPKIPKIGKWTDNPLDAIMIAKDGVASDTIVVPLLYSEVEHMSELEAGVRALREQACQNSPTPPGETDR